MRKRRTYALFARPLGSKKGTRWVRMSSLALTKQRAVSVFQGSLLDGTMQGLNMALRPASWIEPRDLPPVPQEWLVGRAS